MATKMNAPSPWGVKQAKHQPRKPIRAAAAEIDQNRLLGSVCECRFRLPEVEFCCVCKIDVGSNPLSGGAAASECRCSSRPCTPFYAH